mmetsp:Transcript_4569/g.13971  ORF Transcript_4569/g.13971 Transcript_4569/m.13971 type:complete len:229 (+) Transcript_4569:336-1022(+)
MPIVAKSCAQLVPRNQRNITKSLHFWRVQLATILPCRQNWDHRARARHKLQQHSHEGGGGGRGVLLPLLVLVRVRIVTHAAHKHAARLAVRCVGGARRLHLQRQQSLVGQVHVAQLVTQLGVLHHPVAARNGAQQHLGDIGRVFALHHHLRAVHRLVHHVGGGVRPPILGQRLAHLGDVLLKVAPLLPVQAKVGVHTLHSGAEQRVGRRVRVAAALQLTTLVARKVPL